MASELTDASRMRDHVFVSYSHKIVTHLKVVEQSGRLAIWSDERIQSGQNWRVEIDAAISRASVALLLASADFLTSEFIRNDELPKILTKHQNDLLYVFWVPLKAAAYPATSLAKIQTAGGIKLDAPLESLSVPEQNRVMSAIALEINQKLGQSVRVPGDARQSLVEKVRQRLLEIGVDVVEEIGCGDTSIVFKGRQGFREYAVKVLVNGGVSASERKDLKERLQKISNLDDPAYIKIHNALLEVDRDPICIICEYVRESRPLDHVLNQCRGLPPHDVILYVRQLARALKEAHDHGLYRRKLLPSNILIEKPWREGSRARLSSIVFLTETHSLRLEHGTIYTTKEALNYIAPEDYYGEALNEKTDQYALGLVALSMLQGEPPVAINHMDDLAKLPEFFENPRKFFDKAWRDRAPGLSRVIARMLCKEPGERWDSMAAVLNAIEPLQRSQRGQEVHVADAKQSYYRYCFRKKEFYESFYVIFRRLSSTADKLFADVSMERQYEMVDEAIERLLNFRDGAEPTTLSRTRKSHHDRFALASDDFDHFRDAFLEALAVVGEHDPEVLDSLV